MVRWVNSELVCLRELGWKIGDDKKFIPSLNHSKCLGRGLVSFENGQSVNQPNGFINFFDY